MLDDVNALGQVLISQLDTVTSELHDRQAMLHDEITQAKSALASM